MFDNNDNKQYEASSIQVLEGLEAVRKRPGMYIGSTDTTGLHHLVWEIVDNAIDEALAGYCNQITVTITPDNEIIVEDNGRGIPIGINPKSKVSTVETVFTYLHAGGKFGGKAYKVSGGLHGVGASVVNALSAYLEVWVYRDHKVYYQRFSKHGKPDAPLKAIGDTEKTGTVIKFKPDPEIFTETTVFKFKTLESRFKQLAYLNKNLKITLIDQRTDERKDFHYPGGLVDFVHDLDKNQKPINPEKEIIYFQDDDGSTQVEVAMEYTSGYEPKIYSFCNNINTYVGGTHEDGFKMALLRELNRFANNNNLLRGVNQNLSREDALEGLTAVISVKTPNPQYEGQTKRKLGNSELRKVVSNITSKALERYFLEHPQIIKLIIDKSLLALKARLAAIKAREMTRRKSALEISTLPGKLADCATKDRTRSELFLVEGNSAGGSAKLARNQEFQAILPLRGKVINVEKSSTHKIFENKEISSLIVSLNCGINEEVDLSKLRYNKIIIMTDADVDGSHIRILLLTFFFRYMRPLIEEGHVYIAQPPLFKVSAGNNTHYCYSDLQLEKIKQKYGDAKLTIQRYKGLGEMNPGQLWETTMDPEVRTMFQVSIDDVIEADKDFDMLMGKNSKLRLKFIQENALDVQNLDV